MQRRARKMMCKEHAAIRNGVEKRLPKIKARMPTHCKPEVAGPSQCEGEKEPGGGDAHGSQVALAWIPEMDGAEKDGKQYCGRPESNPLCQRILRITPE